MARQTFRQRRMLVAVLAVGLYIAFDGALVSPVAASTSRIPECEFECGPSTDCNAECRVQIGEALQTITCGEYNGGAASNQCNTCDFECTNWSAPTQECWIGGNQSDCQTDGPEYAVCGDGTCQNGSGDEGCDSCSLDCGDCPEIVCGDAICDPGETYVTCPADCDDPGSGGFCGDGICSAEDEEDYENCQKDCVTPNERCEDDLDCGAGYTCIPGGEPYGGQCLLFEQVMNFEPCVFDTDCDPGFVCRQIDLEPDPNQAIRRCIWFWEAYTR